VHNQFGLSAEKLLFEFGWREYWRHVWYAHGMQILQDMATPKVLLEFNLLPEDVLTNSTGLPCMDTFIEELAETGYLHNHARMWLASYLVHWRKTDWKLAADWMHNQLLDGDYASNHLSWQWIASTFSHKPYFFNQENLAKYTHHEHCNTCTAQCPFRDNYSNLENKLFQPTEQSPRHASEVIPKLPLQQSGDKTIIWIHDEMLNPDHPLMSLPHDKVFIFSPHYYKDWSILRLQFIADCLAEMPEVSIWIGAPVEVFRSLNVYKILTQETPNHNLKNQASGYPIDWIAEKRVSSAAKVDLESITSFSRFWKTAKHDFLKS
jgi:deoxyribodipyrimidine photo-lyase